MAITNGSVMTEDSALLLAKAMDEFARLAFIRIHLDSDPSVMVFKGLMLAGTTSLSTELLRGCRLKLGREELVLLSP